MQAFSLSLSVFVGVCVCVWVCLPLSHYLSLSLSVLVCVRLRVLLPEIVSAVFLVVWALAPGVSSRFKDRGLGCSRGLDVLIQLRRSILSVST